MKIIIQVPSDGTAVRGYDWRVLFDGHKRELERGLDFECEPASLVRTVRRAARQRGIPVDVSSYLRDQQVVVAVKAHPVE